MFDVWLGGINFTLLVLLFSLVVVLPVQLLLCFRVRSGLLRLLPAGLFGGAAAVLGAMSLGARGWDGLFYLLFGIYAAFLLLVCGAGWGIWAAVRRFRRKNRPPRPDTPQGN